MRGSGKGPLRVAIEDFLNSFDLGLIWHKWYTQVLEKFEDEALDLYEEIVTRLNYSQYLPDILQPETLRTGLSRKPVKLIGVVMAIGSMTIGIMLGSIAPLTRLGTYKVDATVKSHRPDPMTLLAMHLRQAGTTNPLDTALSDLGLSPEYIEGYQALSYVLLTPFEYVQAYRRGELSQPQLYETLQKAGLRLDTINLLLEITLVIPNVGDLIRMAVRDAFSPEVIQRFGYDDGFPADILPHTRKQGLSDDWVKRYWYAHWTLPSPTQGFEMLHRLRPGRTKVPFLASDLDTMLRAADYAPYFRERLTQISYTPLTRVDIRRVYKLGLMSFEDMIERYRDIGYTVTDAETLAMYTRDHETASGEDSTERRKELTASLAKRLYHKGIETKEQYIARLRALRYGQVEIDSIVKLSDLELLEDMTPDHRKDYQNDMTKAVESAYQARMITEDTARRELEDIGVPGPSIDYIIAHQTYKSDLDDLNAHLKLLVDGRISGAIPRDTLIAEIGRLGLTGAQQLKVIDGIELHLRYRNRRLTEAQYRAAARQGLITENGYREALVGMGYTDPDIELLVQMHLATEE